MMIHPYQNHFEFQLQIQPLNLLQSQSYSNTVVLMTLQVTLEVLVCVVYWSAIAIYQFPTMTYGRGLSPHIRVALNVCQEVGKLDVLFLETVIISIKDFFFSFFQLDTWA